MAKPPKTIKQPPAGAAYAPPIYTVEQVGAMKALARGEAQPHQQKLALDWIIYQASGTYDQSYRPDSDRDTAFAEGRRFVGLNIVKLTTTVNLEALRKDNDGSKRSTEQPRN